MNSDIHPWATLFSTLIVGNIFFTTITWKGIFAFMCFCIGGAQGVCALDVTFRQAKSIRQAAAGLDRLILRDDERQVCVRNELYTTHLVMLLKNK